MSFDTRLGPCTQFCTPRRVTQQAIDGRRMKLDAQNGVVFLLGSPGNQETGLMVEAARRLDGVEKVVVYPEKRESDSRF